MDDLRSRVAYLHGLAEGLEVEDGSAQGRVLMEMVNVLGEMAEGIHELESSVAGLAEFINDVDDDLTDLAEDVYLEGEDFEEGEANGDQELHCPNCGQVLVVGAGTLTGSDETIQIVCPNCSTLIGYRPAEEEEYAEG